MARYFSYDPDDGFALHETAEKAREAAEASIDYYRDESSGDGWNEDDVCQVCWGVVSEITVQVSREPAPEGSCFDYFADFGLKPV